MQVCECVYVCMYSIFLLFGQAFEYKFVCFEEAVFRMISTQVIVIR